MMLSTFAYKRDTPKIFFNLDASYIKLYGADFGSKYQNICKIIWVSNNIHENNFRLIFHYLSIKH